MFAFMGNLIAAISVIFPLPDMDFRFNMAINMTMAYPRIMMITKNAIVINIFIFKNYIKSTSEKQANESSILLDRKNDLLYSY